MKKTFILCLLALLTGAFCSAQRVFTVVYAESNDGFVNIRSMPSNSGRVLGRLEEILHGLGEGQLLGEENGWYKVKKGSVVGYAYKKYVGTQTWYSGRGRHTIIAKKSSTPIYYESYNGSLHGSAFGYVSAGTIIADCDYTVYDNYIYLETAHDGLIVMKSDVIIK